MTKCTQGEWYYDASTGYVYYAASAGEDPNEETVVLALLEEIINADGLQVKSPYLIFTVIDSNELLVRFVQQRILST